MRDVPRAPRFVGSGAANTGEQRQRHRRRVRGSRAVHSVPHPQQRLVRARLSFDLSPNPRCDGVPDRRNVARTGRVLVVEQRASTDAGDNAESLTGRADSARGGRLPLLPRRPSRAQRLRWSLGDVHHPHSVDGSFRSSRWILRRAVLWLSRWRQAARFRDHPGQHQAVRDLSQRVCGTQNPVSGRVASRRGAAAVLRMPQPSWFEEGQRVAHL